MDEKDAVKELVDTLVEAANRASPAIERGLRAITREAEQAQERYDAAKSRIGREHAEWVDEIRRRR